MKKQEMTALDHLGRQFALGLTHHSAQLPHDVSERLRFARQKALAARKTTSAPVLLGMPQTDGSLTLGGDTGEGLNRWNILGSALPLIALMIGLFTLHWIDREEIVADLAAIDSALLVDELPPAAYTDPGFAQFLKNGLLESKAND